MSSSPLGTISSARDRVLRPKLLATYRRHLLSAELMLRAEWQGLVFYSASFLIWRVPELTSAVPYLSILVLFPISIPSSFPSPSPPLLLFPSPLQSPFPSCVRPLVSTPVPVPVPALSLLLSPFPPCVHSLAPTPVPVRAPSPAPSPFQSPFPAPLPVPAQTPIPPPTLLAPSRPSDPVTH